MSVLSFLNTAKVEVVTKRTGGGGSKKPWNPEPSTVLAIRVWKDGSVFPSQALVDKFNLEYRPAKITKGEEVPYSEAKLQEHKDKVAAALASGNDVPTDLPKKFKPSTFEFEGGIAGNGFDVIDSRKWNAWKAEGNMLFIAAVSKDEPKVDLFGSTKYDEPKEGTEYSTPVSSVLDQGSKTYGADTLVEVIKEVYGIELNDNREYIDMFVFSELNGFNISKEFSKPITVVPKVVNRGKDKGQADYERRENITIYGFAPEEVINAAQAETAVEDTKATTEVAEEVQA